MLMKEVPVGSYLKKDGCVHIKLPHDLNVSTFQLMYNGMGQIQKRFVFPADTNNVGGVLSDNHTMWLNLDLQCICMYHNELEVMEEALTTSNLKSLYPRGGICQEILKSLGAKSSKWLLKVKNLI
jgi:hypothetical protein